MRAFATLLALGMLVPAASLACTARRPDASPEAPASQPPPADPEPATPQRPAVLDYGSSRPVELRPPTGPDIAIFEGEQVELLLDAQALAERVSAGSAFEFIRLEIADAASEDRPARFSLEPGLTMNITVDFLLRGDAGVRVKGTSGSADHVLVVPWTYRSAPNRHGQGGVEVRMPTGQVVMRVMSWIE